MQFSFQLLVDVPVLTDVPLSQQIPMSVEDLISQPTSESGSLKTLNLPVELLIWSFDTTKLGHQIQELVMALLSLYFFYQAN